MKPSIVFCKQLAARYCPKVVSEVASEVVQKVASEVIEKPLSYTGKRRGRKPGSKKQLEFEHNTIRIEEKETIMLFD